MTEVPDLALTAEATDLAFAVEAGDLPDLALIADALDLALTAEATDLPDLALTTDAPDLALVTEAPELGGGRCLRPTTSRNVASDSRSSTCTSSYSS
mmetsp:Transcript_4348/g.8380  ORF Transcript_4348/g.8380 Transcript_4348/m.8380 type:complete len:97 (-) Transcript_4348:231-521(-)